MQQGRHGRPRRDLRPSRGAVGVVASNHDLGARLVTAREARETEARARRNKLARARRRLIAAAEEIGNVCWMREIPLLPIHTRLERRSYTPRETIERFRSDRGLQVARVASVRGNRERLVDRHW